MKYLEFNANQNVKIKLTDKGIEHIVRKTNEILPFKIHTSFKEYKSREDKNGYHTFQLWEIIDLFGNLGMTTWQYFDINIIFERKHFTLIKKTQHEKIL
jgi:hypothetical protein